MHRHRTWIPVAALAVMLVVAANWRSWSLPIDGSAGLADQVEFAPTSLADVLWKVDSDAPPAVLDPDAATLAGFEPLLEGETVHADAVDVPVPIPLGRPGGQATPGALPTPTGAQPIDGQTAYAEHQLDDLIARELANLPEHQRSVWREVLQGLPAKEAEEILQIWKLTGRFDAAQQSPPWSSAGASPVPVSPFGNSPREIPPAIAETVRRNLDNIDTPGFRRREVVASQADTVQLDLTPGDIRQTGNPLHIAIDGQGFFCLQRGELAVFTRGGRFELSDSGELIQRRVDGDWSLSPPIQIPANAVQFRVLDIGEVQVRTRQVSDTWQSCGSIRLASFLNPQHLATFDAELLTPSAESGAAFIASAAELGHSRLRQHALEMSNATIATETTVLDRWEQRSSLLKRLPMAHSLETVVR